MQFKIVNNLDKYGTVHWVVLVETMQERLTITKNLFGSTQNTTLCRRIRLISGNSSLGYDFVSPTLVLPNNIQKQYKFPTKEEARKALTKYVAENTTFVNHAFKV
jgi:hypothetical protein